MTDDPCPIDDADLDIRFMMEYEVASRYLRDRINGLGLDMTEADIESEVRSHMFAWQMGFSQGARTANDMHRYLRTEKERRKRE